MPTQKNGVSNMKFRELETALNEAWHNQKVNHTYLMGLQNEWECQIDHFTDNPKEFVSEIDNWGTPYLREWVETTGALYRVFGEDFTVKNLHMLAKQELEKRPLN